ncbi:MAG: CopD family protein, partial [Pseudolabrys sp.]
PVDGGATLRIPVSGLARGTHVLSWRVVSADGHPVGGALLFSIGTPTGNPFQAVESDPVRGALFVIARVLLFVGLFGGIGGSLFLTLHRGPIPGAARAARLAIAVGVIALPLLLALQALDSLGAPVSALLDLESWRVAFASSVAWMALTAFAGFILGLIALSGRIAPRLCAGLATLCAAVALAMTGHASSAPPQWLSRPAVFLHIAGLCFWLGSLLPLALALIRTPAPQAPLARFSKLIPLPLIVLIVAGGVLIWVQVPDLRLLPETGYGRLLIGKLVLVVVLLALAAGNRISLAPAVMAGAPGARRRLFRTISAEIAVALAILGLVAGWRLTPPPRALAAVEPAFVHLHDGKAMADITVTPGRPGPVNISVRLMREDGTPIAAKELSVSLEQPGLGIEPLIRTGAPTEPGAWEVSGLLVPTAGTWTIAVTALIDDFDKIVLDGPVLVQP